MQPSVGQTREWRAFAVRWTIVRYFTKSGLAWALPIRPGRILSNDARKTSNHGVVKSAVNQPVDMRIIHDRLYFIS